MSNEELVERIRFGHNVKLHTEQLWQQMENLVRYVAMKYTTADGAELDDLMQEGYIALWHAVHYFDYETGTVFSTYAAECIKRHLQRYLDNNGTSVRIPVYEHTRIKRYKAQESRFLSEHGRKPTDMEMCRLLGLKQDVVQDIRRSVYISDIKSIYAPAAIDDELTVEDMLAADDNIEDDVIDSVHQEQLKAVLWKMVEELPEECKDVIKAVYQDGKSLKQISEEQGIRYNLIRSRKDTGINILSRPHNRRRLQPYMDEYVSAYVYRRLGAFAFQRTGTSITESAALKLYEYPPDHRLNDCNEPGTGEGRHFQ